MRNTLLILSFTIFFIACSGSKNSSRTTQTETKDYFVSINTEFGTMKVRLYNETPLHRDNFLKLTREGFYDSLLFHRVIAGFMIQGGDPDSKNAKKGTNLGNGGPGYTLPAEIDTNLIHKKGVLAAARLGDDINPSKKSSGSQFYLVQGRIPNDRMLQNIEQSYHFKYTDDQKEAYHTLGGTPHLDRNYTVFGEIIEGFEVLDAISALKGDRMNRPKKDVIMTIKEVN